MESLLVEFVFTVCWIGCVVSDDLFIWTVFLFSVYKLPRIIEELGGHEMK